MKYHYGDGDSSGCGFGMEGGGMGDSYYGSDDTWYGGGYGEREGTEGMMERSGCGRGGEDGIGNG